MVFKGPIYYTGISPDSHSTMHWLTSAEASVRDDKGDIHHEEEAL
jgi:hypothetical protein